MYKCVLCGESLDQALDLNFQRLKRITSDCRIWPEGGSVAFCTKCNLVQRPRTVKWLKECQIIYSAYEAHHQGKKSEQRAFNEIGLGVGRSERLLQHFFKYTQLNSDLKFKWLDFGCGEGHFLKELSAYTKFARIFGCDFGTKRMQKIEAICGAGQYFDVQYEISEKFDYVSLIHVLEHFLDPLSEFKKLSNMLNDDGILFVQVPNLQENPFDLLVADHGCFFTKETISFMLNEANFEVVHIAEDWINKEISILAKKNSNKLIKYRKSIFQDESLEILTGNYLYLDKIKREILERKKYGKISIFGSSIGATWAANEADLKFVDCFVDEDLNRVGFQHLGVPIKYPTEDNMRNVIFPVDKKTLMKLFAKYSNGAE